ncbi:hypothetical protein MA9V1_098 [Chryseobacterium phage MA9V-1]|nr:hypothetical protein MA9V1_098 [Chryseobacterium phage MA9V-1]
MNFNRFYKRLLKKCVTLTTILIGIWLMLFLNGVDSMVQYITSISVVVGYFAGGVTMVKEIKTGLADETVKI